MFLDDLALVREWLVDGLVGEWWLNWWLEMIGEWFGYGYGTGISYRPFDESSLSFSVYLTDFMIQGHYFYKC